MQIESFAFKITAATFRYITDSWSGAGWDFNFVAVPSDEACRAEFSGGVMLRTEAAPLPLSPAQDYTGVGCVAVLPYDEATGEALFGLLVREEHDVFELKLKFEARAEDRYLISIEAQVDEDVLGHVLPLKLRAWTQQLPDHAYPT